MQFYWVRKPSITTLKFTFFRPRPHWRARVPPLARAPPVTLLPRELGGVVAGAPRELGYWLLRRPRASDLVYWLRLTLNSDPRQSFHAHLSFPGRCRDLRETGPRPQFSGDPQAAPPGSAPQMPGSEWACRLPGLFTLVPSGARGVGGRSA